jgi:hypothetical protein
MRIGYVTDFKLIFIVIRTQIWLYCALWLILIYFLEKKHLCGFENCGESFVSRSELTKHVKEVHPPFCFVCSKEFATRSVLKGKYIVYYKMYLEIIYDNFNLFGVHTCFGRGNTIEKNLLRSRALIWKLCHNGRCIIYIYCIEYYN